MTLWLALETAADEGSVAVGRPGQVLAEATIVGARRHTAAILPLTRQVLGQAGAGLDDLTGIVVSDGPGSFTGLRVSATLAKGLVRARGLRLRSAPALLALAWRARGHASGTVVAVANALRGDLYAAAYRFAGTAVTEVMSPTVLTADDLSRRLPVPAVLAGAVPQSLAARLEAWAGQPMVGPPVGAPSAGALLELLAGDGTVAIVDVALWEPEYGRPAEAQAKWEREHGRALPDSAGPAR